MAQISPLADNRLSALPDGTIKCIILEGRPRQEMMPNFRVLISKEMGSEITHLIDDSKNQFVFFNANGQGTKDYYLEITPRDFVFSPATYRLRVLQDREEILNKPLVVKAHPAVSLCSSR